MIPEKKDPSIAPSASLWDRARSRRLYLLDELQGSVVGLVVAALGFLGLVTGATGRCPLYVPFGFTTVKLRSGAPVQLIDAGCRSIGPATQHCCDAFETAMW